MPFGRPRKGTAKEPLVAIDDPLYLVVPESQWSRANEIIENLDG